MTTMAYSLVGRQEDMAYHLKISAPHCHRTHSESACSVLGDTSLIEAMTQSIIGFNATSSISTAIGQSIDRSALVQPSGASEGGERRIETPS